MSSQHNLAPPDDPLGAFCRENHVAMEGATDDLWRDYYSPQKTSSTSLATAPGSANRTGYAPTLQPR